MKKQKSFVSIFISLLMVLGLLSIPLMAADKPPTDTFTLDSEGPYLLEDTYFALSAWNGPRAAITTSTSVNANQMQALVFKMTDNSPEWGILKPSFYAFCGNYIRRTWGDKSNAFFQLGTFPYDFEKQKRIVAALDYINDTWSLGEVDPADNSYDAVVGRLVAGYVIWSIIHEDIDFTVNPNATAYFNSFGPDAVVDADTIINIYNMTLDPDFINAYYEKIARLPEGEFYISDIQWLIGEDLETGEIYNNDGDYIYQPLIVPVFDEGKFHSAGISFNKMIYANGELRQLDENDPYFLFDLYKIVGGNRIRVNDINNPYTQAGCEEDLLLGGVYCDGTVIASDLEDGDYVFVERGNSWILNVIDIDGYLTQVDGLYFSVELVGGTLVATWRDSFTNVVNEPKRELGPAYGTVTATNAGNRPAIIAGLNPQNGNACYNDKKCADTPFVVPNSNHFVFAQMTRAELEAGVDLDFMVGNKYDIVGHGHVQLVDGNIVLTIDAVGDWGLIAFNQLPVFNNGNIHSQKIADLQKFGATTGFNHNGAVSVPCPTGDTIYLYFHAGSMQFYQ